MGENKKKLTTELYDLSLRGWVAQIGPNNNGHREKLENSRDIPSIASGREAGQFGTVPWRFGNTSKIQDFEDS